MPWVLLPPPGDGHTSGYDFGASTSAPVCFKILSSVDGATAMPPHHHQHVTMTKNKYSRNKKSKQSLPFRGPARLFVPPLLRPLFRLFTFRICLLYPTTESFKLFINLSPAGITTTTTTTTTTTQQKYSLVSGIYNVTDHM